MENRNRMRRRSPGLPDVIIQHIHSFLDDREAAKTMLVSKSWLRAWSTGPVLIFDTCLKTKNKYNNTSCRYCETPSDFIDRTLQSYVDQGIHIVRFHLYVRNTQERWLKMARQCNVVELHLGVGSNWTASMFQEIFLTQSLQVLSIVSHGYQVALNLTYLIKCLNLKKLYFHYLVIHEVTFLHIMSSCPLIEELMLFGCDLIVPPSYNCGIQSFIFAAEFVSIKRLSLFHTKINDEQLHTILSKSPLLEDFKLSCCSSLSDPINLSSVCLKHVSLDTSKLVVIDAPDLCKLKFTSCRFGRTSFPVTITSPMTKGTVKVNIRYFGIIVESWFHGLKELLAKFAKSNVKFTSHKKQPLSFNFMLRATSLPLVNSVETLRFKGYTDLPLLYAFLTICHPKIVLLDRMHTMCKGKLLKELKEVRYRGNLECCNFNDQNKCWRHYIKDWKLYYVVDNEKKPLDINELKTKLENREGITLCLEW